LWGKLQTEKVKPKAQAAMKAALYVIANCLWTHEQTETDRQIGVPRDFSRCGLALDGTLEPGSLSCFHDGAL